MRKLLRVSLLLGLLVMFMLPAAGVLNAQSSDCDLQNGALISTISYGVNCLDGNGWNQFQLRSSNVFGNKLYDVTVCPDSGDILTLHNFGLNRFDGTAWSDFGIPLEVIVPKAVACVSSDDIWIAHLGGISHFNGSSWNTFKSKDLGSSPFIISVDDVAIGADGSVWATTSNSIARFNGDGWDIFENGKGLDQDYNVSGLAVNSDGQPVAATSQGLLKFDGDKWSSVEAPVETLQNVLIDSKNRVWVGSFNDGVAVLDDGNWTNYRVEDGLSSNSINALAADAQGRIWVGTQWGLNVFDGDSWTVYQMGNSDLLDNNVQQISVLGDGPALPALEEKATGSVTGALVVGREPQANLQVELCTESLGGVFYGDTPCAGQPGEMLTTSDDQGEFTFEGVPPGRYDVTIETPSGWIYFIGIDTKVEVTSGETNDLAFVDIGN